MSDHSDVPEFLKHGTGPDSGGLHDLVDLREIVIAPEVFAIYRGEMIRLWRRQWKAGDLTAHEYARLAFNCGERAAA